MQGQWMEQKLREGPTFDPSHVQTPVSDTISDTLLCLQTGAQHNCPLRGSIQQLTEIEADTHTQTLDEVPGLSWKSWRKN